MKSSHSISIWEHTRAEIGAGSIAISNLVLEGCQWLLKKGWGFHQNVTLSQIHANHSSFRMGDGALASSYQTTEAPRAAETVNPGFCFCFKSWQISWNILNKLNLPKAIEFSSAVRGAPILGQELGWRSWRTGHSPCPWRITVGGGCREGRQYLPG